MDQVFSEGSIPCIQKYLENPLQRDKIRQPKRRLWPMDSFQLKAINVQKTQEETLTFPLADWRV